MSRTYLDVASAAPWHPAAAATHARVARDYPGDPARRHREGRAAGDLLERARSAVASALGGSADRLAFTSGGTEAIHLAVRGAVLALGRRPRAGPARVVSAAVEHSSVLAAAGATGCEDVRVRVDRAGRVDLDALAEALAGGALLCNVQHANHEVGTLQPLGHVAALCRDHGVPLHVDACQTAGRLPVDLGALGADFVSVSGAKFGGGRGVGALCWSPAARLAPLLSGDERERRRRSGLENLPGVAAMAEALLQLDPPSADGAAATEARRADALRRRLRGWLADAAADVEVHGPLDDALPHLVAASALYVDGEALVEALDRDGFAVHSGSSCASTSGQPSHVLEAMGALTHGHVRASFGPEVGEDGLRRFAGAFATAVGGLRARVGR